MAFFGGTPASQSPFGQQFGSAASFGTPSSSASVFGTPASSASLFGAPASSASLFGAASSAALFATPASSASLFGTPASSPSLFAAPDSSASLFGAPASSASLFGAPAASPASLFGAPAASSASLFGAPAYSASLFGAPASSASLFGSQPTSSIFAPAAPAAPAAPPAPPPPIPGDTKISALPQHYQTDLLAIEQHLREQQRKASQLWGRHQDAESRISEARTRADNTHRRAVKLRAEMDALYANVQALRSAVRIERAAAEPVVQALERLSGGINGSGTTTAGAMNGDHFQTGDTRYNRIAHVPDDYFARIVAELEARAHEYKSEIDEIAEFLRAQGVVLSSRGGNTVDGNNNGIGSSGGLGGIGIGGGMGGSLVVRGGGSGGVGGSSGGVGGGGGGMSDMMVDSSSGMNGDATGMEGRGKTIQEVIRRQYDYFMVVASHVASVHEGMRPLREHVVQLLRLRDADAPSPFEQADLREKANKDRQRMLAEKQGGGGVNGNGGVGGGGGELNGGAGTILATRSDIYNGRTATGRLSGVGAPDGLGVPGLFGGVTGLIAPINPGADTGTNGTGSARRLSGGRRRRM